MIDSFLKYLQFEKRVSANTVLAYQNDLSQFSAFIQSMFQENNTANCDYGMIRSWIIQLVETGLEAPSINRKLACLSSYYKFLLRREIISKDPTLKVRVLKVKKKLPSFVKEGDMVKLLDTTTGFEDTFEGWRNKLMLELFYATGIRLSELIYLKEHQIDLHNRTIKVLGKRNKERVIPFIHSIVPIIERYCMMRNKEVDVKPHGFLFVTEKGDRCYPMMVYRMVNKYLSTYTSSEKRSPHVLRHTYATHLLNKGAEISAVKDLLGHTSLAATQVYTHNTMEKLKKAFDQAHPKA